MAWKIAKQYFNYLLNRNLVKTGLLSPFLSKMITYSKLKGTAMQNFFDERTSLMKDLHIYRNWIVQHVILEILKQLFLEIISFDCCNQKQPLEEFYKKAVFKNFTVFTEKYLCWSLFLIKLLKKRLQYRCRCVLWIFWNF